jgi:hypothetical protein
VLLTTEVIKVLKTEEVKFRGKELERENHGEGARKGMGQEG